MDKDKYIELLSETVRSVLRFSNWQLEQMDALVVDLTALRAVVSAARPLTHNYYMLLDGEVSVPYPHQLQELCDAVKALDKER